NFEKITSRVESKNKDQVRHYYYRLVTRMNKLLGPELALDARNCKETNAAMLRCGFSELVRETSMVIKLDMQVVWSMN
nr:TSL-kinase interacting protein 1-like isoform X1 [Tanacetum cinerariifolium]